MRAAVPPYKSLELSEWVHWYCLTRFEIDHLTEGFCPLLMCARPGKIAKELEDVVEKLPLDRWGGGEEL